MPRRSKRHQRRQRNDPPLTLQEEGNEPRPLEEYILVWGGQRLIVAGFTSGGAPHGATIEEFRTSSELSHARAGWARAKAAIRALAELQNEGSSVEVGWVTRLDQGLYRAAYAADLHVDPDPYDMSGRVVALVPEQPMDVAEELRWLARLQQVDAPFRAPKPIGATSDGILVQSFVPGMPGRGDRWRYCLSAAAFLHGLPFEFESDRMAKAVASLEAVGSSSSPLIRDVHAWCQENLPAGPLVLTHGDLLPQNLLFGLHDEVAVIDWQFAGPGDPAADLAVLTRGVRRPFRLSDGLDKIVDTYMELGGVEVTVRDVLFHELTMVASWVASSKDQHHVDRLRSCLARASSAA